MDDKGFFKCQGDNLEEIPSELVNALGVAFPKAHTNCKDISLLGKGLKDYHKSSVCIIPFCTTVEAEAMGAKIKLGDSKTGPRVDEYIFNSIEELNNLKKIDLTKGRIKEVLDSTRKLSCEGEIVALNVEGPFTIISSLIDPMLFYRGIRKNRELVENAIRIIEEGICEYILEGIKQGAKIISYGDPVGAIDIVGPAVYKDISGKSTYRILKNIETHLGDSILHLCGKTSTAFEKLGLCEIVRIEFDDSITYGSAILRIINEMKNVKILGHSCIKRTRNQIEMNSVWSVVLK